MCAETKSGEPDGAIAKAKAEKKEKEADKKEKPAAKGKGKVRCTHRRTAKLQYALRLQDWGMQESAAQSVCEYEVLRLAAGCGEEG